MTRISPRFGEDEISAIDAARGDMTRSQFLRMVVLQALAIDAKPQQWGGDRRPIEDKIQDLEGTLVRFKDTGTEVEVDALLRQLVKFGVPTPWDWGLDPVEDVDWLYSSDEQVPGDEDDECPSWQKRR